MVLMIPKHRAWCKNEYVRNLSSSPSTTSGCAPLCCL